MVNPYMVGAWVAANNARMHAERARQAAEAAAEAERRLAILEQEHAWSLQLVGKGWTAARATAEAQRETQRRSLYPEMAQQLRRMAPLPRFPDQRAYEAFRESRRRSIERRRTSIIIGPHPVLLSVSLTCVLAIAAWGVAAGAGAPDVVQWIALAIGLGAGIAASFPIDRHGKGLWNRFRERRKKERDVAARRSLSALLDEPSWIRSEIARSERQYWNRHGRLLYVHRQLADLGRSSVDGDLYDVFAGPVKSRIKEFARAASEPARFASPPAAESPSTYEQSIMWKERVGRSTPNQPAATPSKVRDLSAQFDDRTLIVSWREPERQPRPVEHYLITVKLAEPYSKPSRKTFKVKETSGSFWVPDLVRGRNYEVLVHAVSPDDARGPASKPVILKYQPSS